MPPSTTKKKIKCQGECKRDLIETNFYQSNSPLFNNNNHRVNICKQCINKMIDYTNINSIYSVLQALDIAFLYDYYDVAKQKNPQNPFGKYITMANSMPQIKTLRYKDSKFEKSDSTNNQNNNENTYSFDEVEQDLLKDFRPTKDMLMRWGTKYSPEQYIKLENFYKEMRDMNTIETPQDIDYLKKLAVISMKMDEELESGNYSQAKQLGDLFSKYMADSKFRAMDKTEADKTGGIRNFSTIYAECESDSFIPPWEHYRKIRGLTQDILDKTIMHIENFTLRLNRAERMTEPPIDTPKITQEDTDVNLGGE